MQTKSVVILVLSIVFTISYTVFSHAVRTTEYIWIQTRIFGLLAFLFLFLTLFIGELRVLTKIKANFTLFRFHVPVALFSLFLIVLHFISALLDSFKWGKELVFTQYLGFSFSDYWLVFLSLGTLSTYAIILVAFTSHPQCIQWMGYKRWKLIHYFSYLSFVMVYIHSIFLGTDLKTSSFQTVLFPVVTFLFLIICSLFVTRIFHGLHLFEDQGGINLAALFFIVLIIGSTFFALEIYHQTQTQERLVETSATLNAEIKTYEETVVRINQENAQLQDQLQTFKEVNNG